MKKRGVLSGFRKTSSNSTTHEQNNLSVDGESHSSSADLSERSSGMLSSFFRHSPKLAQNYAHCQGAESSDITEKKVRADEIPRVPPRPSEEELRNTITHRLSVNPADVDHSQGAGSIDIREKKARADEVPRVPPRPSEEELRNTITHRLSVNPADMDRSQGARSSDITEKKSRADETLRVPPRPSEEVINSITHRLTVNPIDAAHNQDSVKSREEDEGMTTMGNQEVGQCTEDNKEECVNEAATAADKQKDDLSVDGKSHSSSADLSEKSGGEPSGFFRHSPKPAQSCTHGQGAGSLDITGKKDRADETPRVSPNPSEEVMNSITHRLNMNPTDMDHHQMENQDVGERTEDHSEECVNEAAATVEKEKVVPKKKKVKKKKNPFMPHVTAKSKMNQKRSGEDGTEVLEKNSLMEQLNEFRLDRVHSEDKEDLDSLMEWWSTVKQWEPMSNNEDMTEKEEATAFALTAEKVQRGIRVFNQLFSERAEALWQHIIDLNLIADGLDRFNKRTKVAQITGGSTSAVGGVATIAGLALAPVTMGTSLIITAVGLGVAAAGGLTSASAGISNTVHGSMDRKKVERIVKDFQSKMADIDKCTRFIKRGIENLRELNAPRVKKLKVYDNDFSGINNIYEDSAMAGKAVLINANEITRLTQVTMATGGTAARAVQVAAMATGVLTGLFVAMDIYFVAKDSHELRKGAKSEFAKKIREVAEQLHQGLVELNIIREELQCSESSTSSNTFTMSTSSPSASTYATSLTSSSSTSGISNSSSTSTSIASLSSTSPCPSISSSLSQNTEAHIEPLAQS
ncbi:uncharacterized protein LOC113540685 isoform X2 [Pangasianodon hypophthalmus]|uniref:uncharacterized protein LOC113540685 isoform X2 n=1 Tax=Pangasianodon hypophthalmus TaxID=310915 RepID=UPI002307B73B|nr:uncharacterized protein LOC113540685 isoform X2 [Pangasianodon hypophthalmus]